MVEHRSVAKLPLNLANAAAVDAALHAALLAQGWTAAGTITGETMSRVYASAGAGNVSSRVVPGYENVYIEIHQMLGEEWGTSAMLYNSAGTAVGRTAVKSFFPRQASTTEFTYVVSDGAAGEGPTWTMFVSHNTSANLGVGKYNVAFVGIPIRNDEPFITVLDVPALSGATTLDLVDALYDDLRPSLNALAPVFLYLTNPLTSDFEQVTLTDDAPLTISALTYGYPDGALVSDIPYGVFATDMLPADLEFLKDQTGLDKFVNETYEGTSMWLLAPDLSRAGTIPVIRAYGDDVNFLQGGNVFSAREDLTAGFENRFLLKHVNDSNNFYSMLKV